MCFLKAILAIALLAILRVECDKNHYTEAESCRDYGGVYPSNSHV
jgi:hypothetical protein